jgi:hypothetical protein
VGPGSPGYTRGGGPRSPGDPYARADGPASPEAAGPRSAIKRRSREEEEEQLRKKTGAAKASIAAKVRQLSDKYTSMEEVFRIRIQGAKITHQKFERSGEIFKFRSAGCSLLKAEEAFPVARGLRISKLQFPMKKIGSFLL